MIALSATASSAAPAHALAARRERGGEHREGEHAERKVDEEDPAPRQVRREVAAEERAGDARETEGGAEHPLVAPALARRDDVGDDRLRAHHQPAAAEPLDGAEEHELHHAAAHAAEHRADEE